MLQFPDGQTKHNLNLAEVREDAAQVNGTPRVESIQEGSDLCTAVEKMRDGVHLWAVGTCRAAFKSDGMQVLITWSQTVNQLVGEQLEFSLPGGFVWDGEARTLI